MEKLYTITFSPTGISRFAADKIAESFDTEPILIDLCREPRDEIQIEQQSVCIISVPCYGGRVPQTAIERLAHIHGNGAAAVLCVTYGNRAFEDALLELADCTGKAGFHVEAGCAVAGEHNIMHIYGTGRPDNSDQKEILQFSAEAAEKIKSGIRKSPDFPGSRPYKEYHAAKTEILVDENICISCGQCASKCPVNAISNDGLHLDGNACINCMRCIQICPKKARSISKEFVSALIQKVGKACETRKKNQFYL